ncbi:Stemmadenine O-acetyltransferase [Camellia lanceoleosa]|uniref:Stemmadenine O-acetyltransferase n=1 Tax=Camellia lanceoleosa TaxID=1840588 RepID=A0ACC0FBU4_9ERIC|nr:Stemmadenine O-acetyltransferase [Camellia lanceoleosa]
MARGETSLASPIFISSSIFPPRDPLGFKQTPDTSQERLITRRFCFASSTIAALKAEVGTCEVHPTRVELVTAVIWKCAMAQSGLDKSTVTHAVNVRGKMDPPLPGTALGNIFRQAYAYTNGVVELGRLVGELREGIGKIGSEYLMKLKSENAYEMIMNIIKKPLKYAQMVSSYE